MFWNQPHKVSRESTLDLGLVPENQRFLSICFLFFVFLDFGGSISPFSFVLKYFLTPSLLVPWFSLAPVSTGHEGMEENVPRAPEHLQNPNQEHNYLWSLILFSRATRQTTRILNCFDYEASRSDDPSLTRKSWQRMRRTGSSR